MRLLRVIDLSHNRLKFIEPGFFINVNGSLLEFDVSYNYLTTLDITNIIWTQTIFCKPAIGNRTVVDCPGSGLTRIPSALPLYDNLQIDFTNNSIRNLERISQFGLEMVERIKKLDLSNNQIIAISDLVLDRFRKIQLVNITSNAIKRIPRSLQMLKPCQIALGQNYYEMDSAFGAPREQETIDVMSKSRNLIILLSDINNGTQEWNKKEWKYAWNYYKCDFSPNLIVINYDFVKCDDT
ncbi:Hypothetical predicted protein, partial [Mytilus galloprovincialis]